VVSLSMGQSAGNFISDRIQPGSDAGMQLWPSRLVLPDLTPRIGLSRDQPKQESYHCLLYTGYYIFIHILGGVSWHAFLELPHLVGSKRRAWNHDDLDPISQSPGSHLASSIGDCYLA
jgi:hypothetical protein